MSERPFTPVAWEVARLAGEDPVHINVNTGGYPPDGIILARKVARLEEDYQDSGAATIRANLLIAAKDARIKRLFSSLEGVRLALKQEGMTRTAEMIGDIIEKERSR